MHSNDTLIRKSDAKEFRVTFHSHWSTIVAQDGEEDSVKFAWRHGSIDGPDAYLTDEYIGHKGNSYRIKPRPAR
jgi:hypothetical protein